MDMEALAVGHRSWDGRRCGSTTSATSTATTTRRTSSRPGWTSVSADARQKQRGDFRATTHPADPRAGPGAAAPPAHAGTFTRHRSRRTWDSTRSRARRRQQTVGRDLFANPYATVTLSNVDVYDRFPYVEARHFQIVSDPPVEPPRVRRGGHGLVAFDGTGTAAGRALRPARHGRGRAQPRLRGRHRQRPHRGAAGEHRVRPDRRSRPCSRSTG